MEMSKSKAVWKLHDHVFQGSGQYQIALNDESLTLAVDKNGCFDAPGKTNAPLYGFASLHRK